MYFWHSYTIWNYSLESHQWVSICQGCHNLIILSYSWLLTLCDAWGFGRSSDNLALKEFHWKACEEASSEQELNKGYSSQRAGRISSLKVLSFLRENRALSWIKKVLFSLWKPFCFPWHKHSSSHQQIHWKPTVIWGAELCLAVHNILSLLLILVACCFFPFREWSTS